VRIDLGGLKIDLTDDQADDLRRQLGTRSVRTEDLIDTATAAKLLGTSTEYVRDHAVELNGIKLGNGPKAQWRFDPERLRSSLRMDEAQSSIRVEDASPPKRRRKPAGTGLLEVRGQRP
jgi:hypothetical protein